MTENSKLKYYDVIEIWKIKASKQLNHYKKQERIPLLDKIADYFCFGDSYYYLLNFHNLRITYSSKGTKNILGIDAEHMTIEKLLSRIPKKELDIVSKKESLTMNFYNEFLNDSNILDYKVVYLFNIIDSKGRTKTLLNQGIVLSISDNQKIEHVLGINIDITHLNINLNNTVSFVNLKGGKSYYYLEPNKKIFDPKNAIVNKSIQNILTKKELQIIQFLAEGNSSTQIARELNNSKNTIDTQRRKILSKTGCKNMNQVLTQCLIEGILKL